MPPPTGAGGVKRNRADDSAPRPTFAVTHPEHFGNVDPAGFINHAGLKEYSAHLSEILNKYFTDHEEHLAHLDTSIEKCFDLHKS